MNVLKTIGRLVLGLLVIVLVAFFSLMAGKSPLTKMKNREFWLYLGVGKKNAQPQSFP